MTLAQPAAAPQILGHPRGLFYLAFTEAWERFSFYGMQTLLVLYMASQLLQPGHAETVLGLHGLRVALEAVLGPLSVTALASTIFGLYGAAIYVTPIMGGWLADRMLGRTRTIVLGGGLMAAGHFLMAFEATFLIALTLLIVGNGCFKGNIAAQVGGLYAAADPRRADAFQVFYLAINGGVIASPLVCGTLGELYGWHYGFGAAGVGVLVGLAIYLSGRRHLPPEPERRSQVTRAKLTRHDKRVLALLFAMLPVFSVSIIGNQQAHNVYLVWARAKAEIALFGQPFPVTWLATLDTVLTLSFLGILTVFWRAWAHYRPAPDDLSKIIIGVAAFAISLALLSIGASQAEAAGERVAIGWLLAYQTFSNFGFASVLPVALALYTRAAPASWGSTIIGVYYLQLVGANLLVGYLGGFVDRLSGGAFWGVHAGLVAIAGVLFIIIRMAFGGLLRGSPTAEAAS